MTVGPYVYVPFLNDIFDKDFFFLLLVKTIVCVLRNVAMAWLRLI